MDVFEAIFTRRSIRRYSDKKIEKEVVDKIIQAGMYAPSAVNKQPWHFIIFSDLKTRDAIIEVHPNASMLTGAQMGILICYDESLQHDEGYGPVDCAAATQNMLLAAHAQGLGACWVGVYPRQNRIVALKEIFSLPSRVVPFAVISLGYPAEQKGTPDRVKEERIRREKW
ncbi:MAG: nitroreductase family protein [Bacteroidales bacterium]|nr:nitroreductase family protein [Bacteroidales bacterium]